MNPLKRLLMLELLLKIQNSFKSRNYLLTYLYSLKIFGFYKVINFWCFKIVSKYIPRKPFISPNLSKLRSLCQIKRLRHVIFSHGVNYYFDLIFRLVIYPTFCRFCVFVLQNKFSESTETFKSEPFFFFFFEILNALLTYINFKSFRCISIRNSQSLSIFV